MQFLQARRYNMKKAIPGRDRYVKDMCHYFGACFSDRLIKT